MAAHDTRHLAAFSQPGFLVTCHKVGDVAFYANGCGRKPAYACGPTEMVRACRVVRVWVAQADHPSCFWFASPFGLSALVVPR